MEKNFCLTIEYDGTGYHGWQRQPNGPTIQAVIEKALTTMTGQGVTLVGSGRTDAGVHALGQVANFKARTRIEAEAFRKGLNSILPADIVIRDCRPASPDFHARYDAVSKAYRYQIANRAVRPAIARNYCWWVRRPLNLAAMQDALKHFVGRHDFRSFEAAGSPRSHSVRTIMRAELEPNSRGLIRITMEADGFLRHMVRNIVGTLVETGLERLEPGDIPRLLEARDRRLAPPTAPAQGLFLVKVNYGHRPEISPDLEK